MPDQRNRETELRDPNEQDREIDDLVLVCMLVGASWPWSVEEIGRELGNQIDAADSVARLIRHGLLHQSGEFVFPTRSARRADELQLGTV